MPPSRLFLRALPLLLAACILPACHHSDTHAAPVLGLEAADHSPYIDVPLPLGFTRTFDPLEIEAPKPPRQSYCRYRGGSDFISVTHFYFDFLPDSGWKLQSQVFGSGAVYLRYAKEDETLLVNIFAVQHDTDIVIKVGPTEALVGNTNGAVPQ